MLHAIWRDHRLHLFNSADPAALRTAVGDLCDDALLATAAEESSVPTPTGTASSLVFAPADALDLLGAILPAASEHGDSLRLFTLLARFTLDRIERGYFYPALLATPAEATAPWRMLISREDETFLRSCAAALPAICLPSASVAESDTDDAMAVVTSFVATTADALIRRDVSLDPFFLRAHELARGGSAPAEVHWMSALLGDDRRVRASLPGIEQLHQQVREWTGRLETRPAAESLRLHLRLEEPAPPPGNPEDGMDDSQPADPWRLSFLLELIGESPELIEADDLSTPDALLPTISGHDPEARRAALREELARAAEVYPLLDTAVNEPAPTHIELTASQAYAFLRIFRPALREQGVGLTLPEFARKPTRGLGLTLNITPSEAAPGAGLGLENLLDFDWQIAVGDLRLNREQYEQLAGESGPDGGRLVRFGGRWIEVDGDAARRAMEFLRQQKAGGKMTLAQALRVAYASNSADTGLPVIALEGGSWLGELLQQRATIEDFQQPAGFVGTLRPYQLRGLQWLAFLDRLGLGACLADDMGLGKTIQLIALLLHERADKVAEKDDAPSSSSPCHRPSPTLLFAPTSVVANWRRELERFSPSLKVLVHHGADRLADKAFGEAAAESDIVLTSYALAARDLHVLRTVRWSRLVLDEAQKIKNASATSTLAIRALANGLAVKFADDKSTLIDPSLRRPATPIPRRIALTGTPVENHLSELWSIMDLLNPSLLGSASDFRQHFAIPVQKMNDADRADQLRGLIRPFILRRGKTDPAIASDLPKKMEIKVFCNLTVEQAHHYQRITDQMLGRIDQADGIRRRGLILAALTRLKQICDHPALIDVESGKWKVGRSRDPALSTSRLPLSTALDSRSGKCERLVEMLEEVIEESDKALVFTQYRQMGDLLLEILQRRLKTRVLFLHGGTPHRQRDQLVTEFQSSDSTAPIFILSLRAGGLGLNLTAANHVFHFDRWWNPAVEAQATDRAYRIGQTRNVQVHKFICAGTLEERIDALLTEKSALAGRLIASGDEWLTNLSTTQLRQYLTLSPDAIGEY